MLATDYIPKNLVMTMPGIQYFWYALGLLVVLGVVLGVAFPKKRKRRRATRKRSNSSSSKKKGPASNPRSSNKVRSDDVILSTPINQLGWAEFERLFALYFRAQGFQVEETGVGGSDGGVDLVLTNPKTKERTAVQCKHQADHRPVGPSIIRELHSARLNVKPTCIYAHLITSSDVTQQARNEADARGIRYWHGGTLDMHLSKWAQWKGQKKKRRRTVRA